MLLIFLANRYELFVWKTEKLLQLLKFFRKVLCKFNRKANKIWVDTGSEFYTRLLKPLLQNDKLEMNSADNEENLLLLKNLLEP